MAFYSEKGLKRLINAVFFSIAGFKAAWRHEEAFRQEVIAFIIAIPLAIVWAEDRLELLLLIASVTIVLLVELVNSSIEAVVDRISEDYHELAKRAKDIGSAAVMLAIFLAIMTWLLILL